MRVPRHVLEALLLLLQVLRSLIVPLLAVLPIRQRERVQAAILGIEQVVQVSSVGCYSA